MRKLTVLAAALLSAGAMAPTQAGVLWDFNFSDAIGTGFNDTDEGEARRGALQTAADYVSSFLTSYDATIEMDVDGSEMEDTTLAAAGSNFNAAAPAPGFNVQGDVMLKILGGNGADPDANMADGTVTWNWQDFMWELGNDFQSMEFDFFSTAVHELTHALGFASEITQNGEDGFGGDPDQFWAPFDQFLTDFAGIPIIDPNTFAIDLDRWGDSSLSLDGSAIPGCNAGLRWNGANAIAGNTSGPAAAEGIQIYAPNPWEDGSSGSHLDDSCYTTAGTTSTYMMEEATIDGLGVRDYSNLEIGMLRDIGYTQFGVTANAVPVAPVLYLMFPALGLLGFRSRKTAA